MNWLEHDLKFWVAVAGATVLKLMTSREHSLWKTSFTVFCAVGSAWLLTDPIVDLMGWDPLVYKAPAAALVALTAEGVVRYSAQDRSIRSIQRYFKVEEK